MSNEISSCWNQRGFTLNKRRNSTLIWKWELLHFMDLNFQDWSIQKHNGAVILDLNSQIHHNHDRARNFWQTFQILKSIKNDGVPPPKPHFGFPWLINVIELLSRLSKAPRLPQYLHPSYYYCLSMLSLAGLFLVLQRSPNAITVRL